MVLEGLIDSKRKKEGSEVKRQGEWSTEKRGEGGED